MIGCIPGVKKVKSHLIVDLKIGDVCVKTHIPGLQSKHMYTTGHEIQIEWNIVILLSYEY